jgi:hypothetical protein
MATARKKPKPIDEADIKKKPPRKKAVKAETDGVVEVKVKAKRKPRAKKEPEIIRLKIFWGVFNHQLKRVALFDFNQKKAADKRAEELSQGEKPPHFVQKVKEKVEEVAVKE